MASKRNLRRRSCEGKIKFDSANDAFNFMKKKGPMGRLSVYKCHLCHKYHFGHRPGKGIHAMIEARGAHG